MDGVVVKSTGSWYSVMNLQGEQIQCNLKGKFRMKGIKTTNPVAVGDKVRYELNKNEKTGLINEIFPRFNYIIRKATKLSKVGHIIAANIDQACIIVTLAHPRTSTGFIDRILVTTEAYHIPSNIVFNKLDLYERPQFELMEKLTSIYSDAGYKCLSLSAKTGENTEAFIEMLKNKQTLVTGHSGVGKSALINCIQPRLNLKTKDLSGYHRVGMHTTTFAEMFPLTFGGFIIDSPGIKEFGLTDFSRKEIAERFPEMRKYMHQCKFNNCSHIHEPECAVIEALNKNEIPISRYENYLSILNDDYWEKTENDYR
ncbi:MAG: ribosome small subunit-dependent GTPase A [Bacteroidales bacterium]|nr:ribosome small subunit-dependent GTPase A [Bacteroidales bacterium]MCF8404470.1 ribosome small subunit-dependent GTPase A [Bacteroidales bacterium]